MEKIKEFIADNVIVFIIGLLLLLLIYWLHHDNHRNDKDYNNTDGTVAELNQRISSLEQRIATMSERLENTQKTVDTINRRIDTSTGLAYEIADGVNRAEERLESAIQRSKRIKGIIADVERTDK